MFALFAMVFAGAALFTAGQARSRSDQAKDQVAKIQSHGAIGSEIRVTEQEFSITAAPRVAQAGDVKIEVENRGSMTHELVVVRAPSANALPKVKRPGGERLVGAVDEEAIPESDAMGEFGEIAPNGHAGKSFTLTPGTYVLFCNIDVKSGSTSYNHFRRGMVTTITIL